MSTKIEWTNETWNPVIGCSKISEGCKNCYAEKMAFRLAHMEWNNEELSDLHYCNVVNPDKPEWNGSTHLNLSQLEKPFKWKKPRRIFICSMGDLFHESIAFENINAVFSVMFDNDHHIYQVLTKRPERMLEFYEWKKRMFGGIDWQAKDNVWLGVTVEHKKYKYRILDLLKVPAKIHFVSAEPILSEIDLYPYLDSYIGPSETGHNDWLNGLNWVIAGSETGHNARPMKKEWIESLYNQCLNAGIPFFDKKNILKNNVQQFPII